MQEAGIDTPWDISHREGRARALSDILGLGYNEAWTLSRDHWQLPDTWRVRAARWLLRKELPTSR